MAMLSGMGAGPVLGSVDSTRGSSNNFLPFAEAREYALSLELSGLKEWKDWCRNGERPNNIPSAPDQYYKEDGWQGFAHFLGGTTARALYLSAPFLCNTGKSRLCVLDRHYAGTA